MFIRLFRSHQNIQFVAFLLAAFLLWADGFYHLREAIPDPDRAPLYNFLFSWSFQWPWLSVLLAFLLLGGQAFLFNQILTEEGLVGRNSYLPAFVFMLLFSHSPLMLRMYPALVANTALILALRTILKNRHTEKAYQEIFSSGLMLGLGALLNFYHLIFFLLIWISLILYRSYTWREWMISILGLLTPVALLTFYYFWTDVLVFKIASYQSYFEQLDFFHFQESPTFYILLIWGVLALFVSIAAIRMISRLSEKVIQLRKAYLIIIWTFLLSVALIPFLNTNTELNTIITLVPATVFISVWGESAKKTAWPEIFFWLLSLSIIAGKIFL